MQCEFDSKTQNAVRFGFGAFGNVVRARVEMTMQLVGPVYLVGGQDYNLVYLDWPANDSNTYLLDTGDTLVLVDSGCGESLGGILENVRRLEFDIRDISHVLLTHEHLPHSGGAEALQKMGIEVLASAAAAEAVQSGDERTAAYHYHRRFPQCSEVRAVEDGECVAVGRFAITALSLPGHSPGSMGFALEHEGCRMLFCGDVVRSPLLHGWRCRIGYDPEAYLESLRRLLKEHVSVLYPGHGTVCVSEGRVWIEEELRKVLSAAPTWQDRRPEQR